MTIKNNLIAVFDTETTGLTLHPEAELHKQPRCIEFGGALLSPATGLVVDTLSLLINPGVPLEPIITKITGLTDADLADKPTFADVSECIQAFFARAELVLAHNLPFDRAIMCHEYARLGVDLNMMATWPSRGICTVGLYKDQWGRNPKLTELYEHVMRRPLPQTHRALDDVLALVQIVQSDELWRL